MSETLKIALVGNPNCGKTSLFNILTGLNQKVGNFPGVTVDRKSGSLKLKSGKKFRVVDLPGTYSLYPRSEDEEITTKVLRNPNHEDHPDLVLVVADATNLKRSLLLCTQTIDLGIPGILVLNMADLVDKMGLQIDDQRLENELKIPVVRISALKDDGIGALKEALEKTVHPTKQDFFSIPQGFLPALEEVKKGLKISDDYLAFQALMDPDNSEGADPVQMENIRTKAGIGDPKELLANEFTVRYDRIQQILDSNLSSEEPKESFTEKLDKILLHKVWGYVIFVGILAIVFQSIFAWASYPMDWIDAGFSAVGDWLGSVLPDHFLTDLLINGVWAGLGGIVIFIPQIAFLFLFIAILEDSGYMSRAVFLMDRIMRPFGFSGKSVIPLIGGMACAVPSIMMARNIPNKTERLITILVTPLMSCSARIPVYTLLIGMFVPDESILGVFNLQGLVMLAMYLLGFLMTLVVAWVMKLALKYKHEGMFITELPIYRMPRWKNVGMTMLNKSKTFVWEAGKVILVISIILWVMASFAPGNAHELIDEKYTAELSAAGTADEQKEALERQMASEKLKASYAGIVGSFIEPAIKPLGFDWKIGISLITSFAAREVFVGTMATLYSVEDTGDESGFVSLRQSMFRETYPDTGKPVYTTAVAISLMIFYAFAMQCMSTLAIVRRETASWKWPMVMLVYMTALAYFSSLLVYQVLSNIS